MKSGNRTDDNRTGGSRAGSRNSARIAAGLLFSLLALAGCKDFSFFNELGIAGEIKLNPSDVTLIVSTTASFSASGGSEPYTFQVISGTGTIDPSTGVYTAPAADSTDTIMVTDAMQQSATARVTVVSSFDVLTISPTTASVSVGSSITFVATGGVAPYTFSLQTNNSGGSITAGGLYTAGSTTGVSDTIIVTDSDSPPQTSSVPAVITVSTAVTNVDYTVTADTFPASALEGTPLSGDFTIHNGGSATGTNDISWWLFISEDGSFGGDGERLVASGIVSTDIPAAGDQSVTPAGSWPSDMAAGNYDLFIMISSPDDLNQGNNVSAAIPFSLTVPDVDYQVQSVTNTGGTLAGGAIAGQFVLDNLGTDDGSQPVTWSAYASANAVINPGDTLIDGGSETAMSAAESPRTVLFTGTWPSLAGSYYLIIEVSVADDAAAGNTANNVTSTAAAISVTVPDVDYQVLSVTHLSGTGAGAAVSGNFTLDNTGVDNGAYSVAWEAYASTNTLLDAGDALIDSGSAAPMTAPEAPKTVSFSGSWPAEPAQYYLLVTVSALDDTLAGNDGNNLNDNGALIDVTAADVNYAPSAISGANGNAGGPLSCSFTLSNNGADASSTTVSWNLYVSANAALDAGDTLTATGTAGPLGAAPASTVINVAGATWPLLPGDYYLIVEIESVEDLAAGNEADDVAVSGSTYTAAGGNPDYTVSQVNFVAAGSTHLPDGTVNGDFQYTNGGTAGGSQAVSWEAYASLDPSPDAGDVLVASGTGESPLGAGATSASIPFTGKWPLDFGKYFLVVRVSASDEINPADNAAATAATESIGYFDETAHEPNDDFTGLTDFYDLGITFIPGMSVELSGSLSNSDIDDIIGFNTGTCTQITFAATWSSGRDDVNLYVMDGPNSFLQGVGGTIDAISLNWTVDAAGVQRWLDVENDSQNPPLDGPYTLVITGN